MAESCCSLDAVDSPAASAGDSSGSGSVASLSRIRRLRRRQAQMVASRKLEAAHDRVRHLEGLLAAATAEKDGLEKEGELATMVVDRRIVARLRALAPCLLAQCEAAERGVTARRAHGLVSADTNVLANAARHFFEPGLVFEAVGAKDARHAQRQSRSKAAVVAPTAAGADCGADAAAGGPAHERVTAAGPLVFDIFDDYDEAARMAVHKHTVAAIDARMTLCEAACNCVRWALWTPIVSEAKWFPCALWATDVGHLGLGDDLVLSMRRANEVSSAMAALLAEAQAAECVAEAAAASRIQAWWRAVEQVHEASEPATARCASEVRVTQALRKLLAVRVRVPLCALSDAYFAYFLALHPDCSSDIRSDATRAATVVFSRSDVFSLRSIADALWVELTADPP